MNDGEKAGRWPWGYNYFEFYGSVERCPNKRDVDFSPYTACRVGEAKNPGPFRIAALNIQSLHCALDESKLDWATNDVLALSETCATKFVRDKAAKAAASQGRHSCSSLPVKRRNFKRGTVSEISGESAGVWMATRVHCRPIDIPWPDDIQELCRSCDCILYTPTGLVYMACLYGYHQGFQDASAKTDRILEAIFERSQLLKLPAVVVGDFNSDLENLPVWTCMCERGWADAAILQQQKTGRQPSPTYKEISRIDFVIMNEMAKRAFVSYDQSELPVSDHRMVSATFEWDKCKGLATVYRMPHDMSQLGIDGQAFAEAKVPVACQVQFDQSMRSGSVDQMWTAYVHSIEQVAKNVVHAQKTGPMPPKFLGKDKCKFVKMQSVAPVIKKGRDDAYQAEVQDCGVQLRQRITQIRRIDAFIAQSRASGPATPQREHAQHQTWNAVLRAPGFGRKFAAWFLSEFESPFPLSPPCISVARWIRNNLAEKVPQWRSRYNHTRIRQIKDAFDQDWSKGGRLFLQALRAAASPPVDAIDRVYCLDVQLARARKKGTAAFLLPHDDLRMVAVGQKWTQNNAMGFVANIDNGSVMLKVVAGSFKTGTVNVATTCQNPEHSLRLATDFWRQFWFKDSQPSCDDPVVAATVNALPMLAPLDPCITLPELQASLSTLPIGKARGMDAITNWELKYHCEGLQNMLLQILNHVTATGVWPTALTKARMHLIRKTRAPGDINSTRPICILPNVYRLWGKIMTAKCFRHLREKILPTIFGSVPAKSSTDLAMQLQAEVEEGLS